MGPIKKQVLTEEQVAAGMQEEVWIVGKGPSLNWYNWGNAGEIRVGLNEAALLVPRCTHAFAVDEKVLQRLMHELPHQTVMLIEHRKRTVYANYFKFNRPQHFKYSGGTILVALQVLSYFGVKVAHFVGCDSITKREQDKGYSKGILGIDGQGTNNDMYRTINEKVLDQIGGYGIEPVWEHIDADYRRADNERISH